jgi:hypothetical protein
MEEAMKDLRLEIEELEQRVVPSMLGSTLSVTVALPDEAGIAAPSAAVHDAAAEANGAGGVVSVEAAE